MPELELEPDGCDADEGAVIPSKLFELVRP